MKKYILTTPSITSVYTFREDGKCIAVELNDDIPTEKINNCYQVATFPLENFLNLVTKYKNINIKEVPMDLSFEYAWKKYNHKKGKVKAEEAWKKLKDEDKIKALNAMPAYDRSLYGTTTAKVYFERYCKNRRWEDFA